MTPTNEAARWQMTEAEAHVTMLTALSEQFYAVWEGDAAFYALRAAFAVALTPAQVRRVQQVAIRRRDEHLQTEDGVRAANHGGAVTLDCPLTEALKRRGYRDSYATLVDDIDLFISWPIAADGIDAAYGRT